MPLPSRNRQRGLTGVEILIIIAGLLAVATVGILFAWYAESADNGQRRTCLLQLDQIQKAVKNWTSDPTSDSARMFCKNAQNLINKYNNSKRCPELIGKVGVPECPP